MSVPIALTIAGSDSSGGAGIQADLKTFAALGVYGASVITALTAQNTRAVLGVHQVPPDFIRAQIEAVFADLDVRAVKIGMLGDEAAIEAVADALAALCQAPIVLDPVMVSATGAPLLAPSAQQALCSRLMPLCDLITPNLPEAARLLGIADPAETEAEMRDHGAQLIQAGARAVLIKGGHGTGDEAVDILCERADNGSGERFARFTALRVQSANTHGTGCTLSAAIAAGLAKGRSLEDAVRHAKVYLTDAIAAAGELGVGHGTGPVHHFHVWWR